MKKILALMICLVISKLIFAQTIPTQGLVAFYSFNGSANDFSGNGNNATDNSASLCPDRNGIQNQAYSFSEGNYIEVPNSSSLQSLRSEGTISLWVNIAAWYGSGSATLVCKGNTTSWGQYSIWLSRDDNTFYARFNTGTMVTVGVKLTGKIQTNTWYHLSVTWKNGIVSFYLNGSIVGTQSFTGTLIVDSYPLNIGRDTPGSTEYFIGKMDELRLYNRALSDAEVTALHQGLIAYYPFNGNANDESSNGHNGTVSGATLTMDRFGFPQKAYSFNGSSNNIDYGIVNIPVNAFSVSLWLNPKAFKNSDEILFDINENHGFNIFLNENYSINFLTVASSTIGNMVTTVLGSGSINTWNHIVCVSNNGKVMIYLNGILKDSKTGPPGVNSMGKLFSGYDHFVNNYYFNGSLDDIKIFNGELSSDEINTLYKEGGWPLTTLIAPQLQSPADGATNISATPTLTWSSSAGATSYGLQVSTSSVFSSTIINQTGITTTSYTASGLSAGTKYYWKVNATNASGTSVYSTAFSFTTTPATSGTPITIIVPQTVSAGQEFTVDIQVGSSSAQVTNLKIVSFELTYTNTAIVDYVSDAVGSFITGAQKTVMPDDANGKISASIYRTSGGNSGSGTILSIKFKVLSTATDGQQITFNMPSVQSNDANGGTITLTPVSANTKVSTGLTVWPGDADNNGVVNIFDINTIVAFHWGKTGSARSEQGITWKAHSAAPWSPAAATYADCNGDGIVSIFDINPIVVNFGQTHAPIASIKEQQNASIAVLVDPPITVSAPTFINPNQEFLVEVQMGSPSVQVTNVKIVSFELQYTNTAIVDYVSYEVGSFITGAQVTVMPDDATGKVSASVYRTTGGNSGYGTILRLKFKATSSALHGQAIAFSFGGIQANRDDGSSQLLSQTGKTISITTTTNAEGLNAVPKEFSLGQNYPNPFNPSTTINFQLPQRETVEITIYNSSGQLVRTLLKSQKDAGSYSVIWNGRDDQGKQVPSGTYFYQIKSGSFEQTRKMILLK